LLFSSKKAGLDYISLATRSFGLCVIGRDVIAQYDRESDGI